MKTLNFFSFFIFVFCIAVCQPVFAVTPSSQAGANKENSQLIHPASGIATAPMTKKALRKAKRKAKWEKRIQTFTSTMTAMFPAVDFSDPTKKWLWYAIFAFGISIALTILGNIIGGSPGLFYSLAGIAGLVGLVCLVIWAVKEFGL